MGDDYVTCCFCSCQIFRPEEKVVVLGTGEEICEHCERAMLNDYSKKSQDIIINTDTNGSDESFGNDVVSYFFRQLRRWLTVFLFCFLFSCGGTPISPQPTPIPTPAPSVELMWQAPPGFDPGYLSFRVYVATNVPPDFDPVYTVDAGTNTMVQVNNLIPGVTYSFAATSYDQLGNESIYSNIVEWNTTNSVDTNSVSGKARIR